MLVCVRLALVIEINRNNRGTFYLAKRRPLGQCLFYWEGIEEPYALFCLLPHLFAVPNGFVVCLGGILSTQGSIP